jgi:acetolactate synthase-1/2/3 large subunit
MELTGARIIIEILLEQGVETVFGYPGGQNLDLFDALGQSRLRLIIPAHEQGGIHAVSGKPGVMLATSGPGATNLVTGIASAYLDSVPLLAITCNVPSHFIGRDSFQEVDIGGIVTPVTKHNYFVQDVNQLAETLRSAFTVAVSGRPGPVLIDITKDAVMANAVFSKAGSQMARRRCPPLSETKLAQAVALFDKSRKPLLFCGGGVIAANAAPAVLRMA